ncbi:unnamed protein product [Heligmosomoides polygyrus]|uniref:Uncharacterized protein n=1 Tax=Heligmosomoides polygyrus TaxID=6339 RepID=A0A183FD55_HELPZ|nr:unnamed protein product [Heligmosomoides polygyrus]
MLRTFATWIPPPSKKNRVQSQAGGRGPYNDCNHQFQPQFQHFNQKRWANQVRFGKRASSWASSVRFG